LYLQGTWTDGWTWYEVYKNNQYNPISFSGFLHQKTTQINTTCTYKLKHRINELLRANYVCRLFLVLFNETTLWTDKKGFYSKSPL